MRYYGGLGSVLQEKAGFVRIEDLGVLHGPLLVYGGVYSNLQAFEALVARAKGISPSNMICLGDVVAYCAQPEEAVQAVRALQGPVLAGNCEKQLAAGADDCGCGFEAGSTCSSMSAAWYAHAMAEISNESREWMADLPDWLLFSHEGKRFAAIHGGASEISKFIWPTTADKVIANEVALIEARVGPVDRVLASHSGFPIIRDIGSTKWINVGAIGMPAHLGASETSFVTISENSIEINALRYDHNASRARMEAVGLTQGYHETLASGVWPSLETLPPEMHHF